MKQWDKTVQSALLNAFLQAIDMANTDQRLGKHLKSVNEIFILTKYVCAP